MKTLLEYQQMSEEYFNIWTKRFQNVSPEYSKHPKEDFGLVSEKFPIFVVADGVTLKRDSEGNYPIPSGAGELAELFCRKIIEEAERMYETFSEKDLKTLFSFGNAVAKEFNDSHGIFENNLNFRDFDYFSATTSFALIKDGTLYWWSLHDSGLLVVSEKGEVTFNSPKVVPNKEKFFVDRDEMTETELNKAIRSTYRNKVDENQKPFGYGVVTGEKNAMLYLSTGAYSLEDNSTVILFTDGFENYVTQKEFLGLFANWSDDVLLKLKNFSSEKAKESPVLYGQERTIIAVNI